VIRALLVASVVAVAGLTAGSEASGTGAVDTGRIVFQSDRDGPVDIYSMNSDGTHVRRLTTGSRKDVGTKSEREELVPRWSPDKREIAYTTSRQASASVVVMSSRGRTLRRLGDQTAFASWSHDGKRLALACGKAGSLCVADGASGPEPLVDIGSTLSPPAWSPDDRLIVASGYRGSEPALFNDRPDLFRVPVARATSSRGIGVGGQPDWSPDGKRIVFAAGWDKKSGRHESNPELYLLRVDRHGEAVGDPVRLTHHRGIDAFPAWSPDGRRIAFARQSGARSVDIYVINADGTGLRQLTHDHAFDVAPDW
jgi:TolB protein